MTDTATAAQTEPYRVDMRSGWELHLGAAPTKPGETPMPAIVRGTCPDCKAPFVANQYYNPELGYLLRYECWKALETNGESCQWRFIP